MNKKEVLIKFLKNEYNEEIKGEEITISNYNNNLFEYYNQEYLVLTDEEANEEVKKEIKNTLWAFNSDFIIDHSRIEYSDSICETLNKIQGELCEGCQEFIEALIEDFDDFCDDAISSDGRGHFLSYYDGNENEQNGYFIYRR